MSRKQKQLMVALADYEDMRKQRAGLSRDLEREIEEHGETLREVQRVSAARDALQDRARQLEADLVAERRIRSATIKIAHSVATAWVELFANEARARARDVAEMGSEYDLEALKNEPVPSVKVEVTP